MPIHPFPPATLFLLSEEPSGIEIPVLLGSWLVGGAVTLYSYTTLFGAGQFSLSSRWRVTLALWPVLCLSGLLAVLLLWAAAEVRHGGFFFFLIMGVAWFAPLLFLTPFFGVSFRDDVVERGNPAAAIVYCGAVLAMTLCFAGGSIGEDPILATIVSAILSTVSLLAIWLAQTSLTESADAIAIDRDVASGLRLAGLLTAAGLILGRSVAGDWHSMEGTIHDWLAAGWPAILLGAAAIAVDRQAMPTPCNPRPGLAKAGFAPALAYLVAAGAWVAWLGHW